MDGIGSNSCLVLEEMIHLGEIMFSELQDLLGTLEEQGMITAAEHTALLDLAGHLKEDRASKE